MILVVDIGNTNISFALYKGRRIVKEGSVSTKTSQRQLVQAVSKNFKTITRKKDVKKIVICSVVPRLDSLLGRLLQKRFDIKPLVVGKDIKVPIKNCYKNPRQVGQDRLVGAYAVKELYKIPAIIIDLGTAITLDVLSAKAEYLGGIIVPGIRLTAESLFLKTALLPKTDIRAPRNLIGRSTDESILSGIFYGYGALCEGLIRKIIHDRAFTQRPKIILTGGYSKVMQKFIDRKIDHNDPRLVLKGLALMGLKKNS